MSNEKEQIWLTKKLIYFQDSSSGNILELNYISSMSSDPRWGINSTSNFQMVARESNLSSKVRARIELDYNNLSEIHDRSMQICQNKEDIYLPTTYIRIKKIYPSKSKELHFKFAKLDDKTSKVIFTITDTVSYPSPVCVSISTREFNSLIKLIKNIVDNYMVMASSFDSVMNQERIFNEIRHLRGEMVSSIVKSDQSVKKVVDLVVCDDEFSNKSDDFTLKTNKLESEMVPSFLHTFLRNDLLYMRHFMAAWHTIDSIYEEIFEGCRIPTYERNILRQSNSYNKIYELLKYYTASGIRKTLEENSRDYPDDVPRVRFSVSITNNETPKLYMMVRELISVLIIYNIIRRNYILKFKGVDSDSNIGKMIGVYNGIYFKMKSLFIPFLLSVEIPNWDDYENELTDVFTKFIKFNMFKKIENEYKELTLGSELTLDLNMFLTGIKAFRKYIDLINENVVPEIHVDSLNTLYKKLFDARTNDENRESIQDKINDVLNGNYDYLEEMVLENKTYVVQNKIGSDSELVLKKDDVVIDDSHMSDDIELDVKLPQIVDEQTDHRLEYLKKILPTELLEDKVKIEFDQLLNYENGRSILMRFNLPDEVYKCFRVIDVVHSKNLLPSTTEEELKNKVANWEEPIGVIKYYTQTGSTQSDISQDNDMHEFLYDVTLKNVITGRI
jgi:hypothetical protein